MEHEQVKNRPTGGKGFTLLELLVVIAIIAILATMVMIVFNPGETLKKGRDAQRFSDLMALHTAIAFYTTTFPEKAFCSSSLIYVSIPSDSVDFTANFCPVPGTQQTGWGQVTKLFLKEIDGTGWPQINFNEIPGKSPIGFFPVDPRNISKSCPDDASEPIDYYYRFACNPNEGTWEIDVRLESEKYRESEDRDGGDGGNYAERYEIGRDTDILPADE